MAAEKADNRFPKPKPLSTHGPARIIAMCNQKGGVGKTTTSINLAAALVEYGRKVLLVDFDPQGALSAGLGVNAHDALTIYDLMLDRTIETKSAIQKTAVKNLDVIPANIELSAAEMKLVNEIAREQILSRILKPVIDEYDVIIVDCQPSLGLLTVNALTAAHGVIIPLASEFFALRGVAILEDIISKVQEGLNPALQLDGILATMFDGRTRLAQGVAEDVRTHFADVTLTTVIPRSVKVSEAPSFDRSVVTHDPSSPGAIAYMEAAAEIAIRGEANGR